MQTEKREPITRISVETMSINHVTEVVRIHRAELPDDFCSRLGTAYLERVYYPHLLALETHVALVAVREGRVCGFVTAASASGFYRELLARYPWRTLGSALRAALRHPSLLLYMIGVVLVLFTSRAYQPEDSDVELLYEAVTRDYQRSSIGSRLVQELFCRLAELSAYDRCVVKTLVTTPHTNSFYQRNGFTLLKRALGRAWYQRPIPSPRSL